MFVLITAGSTSPVKAAEIRDYPSLGNNALRTPRQDEPILPPPSHDGRLPTLIFPEVCPGRFLRGVPEAVIKAALEDPTQVSGWGTCANPNQACSFDTPDSPNTPKRMLVLRNPNARYDAWYNTVIFAAGCR